MVCKLVSAVALLLGYAAGAQAPKFRNDDRALLTPPAAHKSFGDHLTPAMKSRPATLRPADRRILARSQPALPA